jgi:hypothetical protein
MLITALHDKMICSPEVMPKTVLLTFDPEGQEVVQIKAANMSTERVLETIGPDRFGLRDVPQDLCGVQLKTPGRIKEGTWTWELRRIIGSWPRVSLIRMRSNNWLLSFGEVVVFHLANYDPEAPLYDVGENLEVPTTAWERLLDD